MTDNKSFNEFITFSGSNDQLIDTADYITFNTSIQENKENNVSIKENNTSIKESKQPKQSSNKEETGCCNVI